MGGHDMLKMHKHVDRCVSDALCVSIYGRVSAFRRTVNGPAKAGHSDDLLPGCPPTVLFNATVDTNPSTNRPPAGAHTFVRFTAPLRFGGGKHAGRSCQQREKKMARAGVPVV